MKTAGYGLILVCTLGCAHAIPTEAKLPSNSSSLNYSPAANQPLALKQQDASPKKSPFKDAAEEDMFWRVVNMETAAENIPNVPVNRVALFLALVLSPNPSPQERAESLAKLLNKFMAFTTIAEDHAIQQALENSTDIPKRWAAMQMLFKRDAEANALLDYALNDKKRMKEYFTKQTAAMQKKQSKEKSEKPAPTLPANTPVQHF